jgi:hypothetical protein
MRRRTCRAALPSATIRAGPSWPTDSLHSPPAATKQPPLHHHDRLRRIRGNSPAERLAHPHPHPPLRYHAAIFKIARDKLVVGDGQAVVASPLPLLYARTIGVAERQASKAGPGPQRHKLDAGGSPASSCVGRTSPRAPAQPVASEHDGLMAISPCWNPSSCNAAMPW